VGNAQLCWWVKRIIACNFLKFKWL
jgi:hypothetical protein